MPLLRVALVVEVGVTEHPAHQKMALLIPGAVVEVTRLLGLEEPHLHPAAQASSS